MSDSSWLLSPSGQRANGAYVDDTLRARASESSLRERYDLAADFPRQRVEVLRSNTPDTTVNNLYYRRGWTDGLPVIAPLLPRVDAMVRAAKRGRNEVMAELDPLMGPATLEKIAANAVMAGCKPEYFPVLVAAFEAMNEEPFNFNGSTASTGGSAPLLIVSGPMAQDIGMNADVNLFGPGNRANATIGRAVRLILMNVFRMRPGISDKSTQGHPGKYSFCIAERLDCNPWPSLAEELGYPDGVSSVTVFAGGGFVNIENHGGATPEAILSTIADAMSNCGCLTLGESVVVLSPEHVGIIDAAGWSKSDVREYLFEHAFRPTELMMGIGKFRQREFDRQHDADSTLDEDRMHRGLGPDDILLAVGGGDAGGHSAFIPSWSRARSSLMQSKPIGVCIDCD